ncbi:hypothetical protein [Burkholderia territorii]|uniref:hypothetical protein n=1 Tax=Burkholderia territorii TaxID=1503055 RepID=UPI0012DA6ABC|nr:hypothetical protein [Burkholderia territorii]
MWREAGEALLVGRRMHKADRAFKQWCDENGFDMSRGARADAMWYAEVYTACTPPAEMTHPTHIRQWHRDRAPAPSPDLALEAPEPTPNLAGIAAQARKIHALANSAEAGDETAKRHLDKKAKDFGGSVEEVVKAARAVAPELTVPADALKTLEATKRVGVRIGNQHDYTREIICVRTRARNSPRGLTPSPCNYWVKRNDSSRRHGDSLDCRGGCHLR